MINVESIASCPKCGMLNKTTGEFCNVCSLAIKLERFAALESENKRLRALCQRESAVLSAALERKNNKSMIQIVIRSLAEQALQKST